MAMVCPSLQQKAIKKVNSLVGLIHKFMHLGSSSFYCSYLLPYKRMDLDHKYWVSDFKVLDSVMKCKMWMEFSSGAVG